jgi:hypothetical protein
MAGDVLVARRHGVGVVLGLAMFRRIEGGYGLELPVLSNMCRILSTSWTYSSELDKEQSIQRVWNSRVTRCRAMILMLLEEKGHRSVVDMKRKDVVEACFHVIPTYLEGWNYKRTSCRAVMWFKGERRFRDMWGWWEPEGVNSLDLLTTD